MVCVKTLVGMNTVLPAGWKRLLNVPMVPAPKHTRQRKRTKEERDYYALSRRVYALLAPFYDFVTRPLARLRHEVVAACPPGPEARVLDIATGTGAQALAFAAACREVVGLDLSPRMLRIAEGKSRSRPNVRYVLADATEMPFDDASFDVSCVSFALHEMPPGVREATLREMARVTRDGGVLVVADYGPPRTARERFVSQLIKLYERQPYADFIRSDLHALLAAAGAPVHTDRRALRGIARIVVGKRASASGGSDRTRS